MTPLRGPLAVHGAEINTGLTNLVVPQVPWVLELLIKEQADEIINYEGPIAHIEVRVEVITNHHV